MKVIINADDCGYSQFVNQEIAKCFELGIINSTTVMANMDDLEGSVALFRKYKEICSFGAHLNLTEGRPLLNSRLLLEKGFYKETVTGPLFNGEKIRYKMLSRDMKIAIKNELLAQMNKLRDVGIDISHIDSHQHIHTAPAFVPIFCEIAKELNIRRLRRAPNLNPLTVKEVIRKLWLPYLRFCYPEVITTKYFSPYGQYIKKQRAVEMKMSDIIELSCHPGHSGLAFVNEMQALIQDFENGTNINFELLTFNQL